MLSASTIKIVKSTAPVLEVHGNAITKVFYHNLFEAHPELLNIFNHANQSKGRQQAALANTVYAAAVHIENLSAIIPVVQQIAQKHRSLGIKAEHYPIVGEFLLKAIKEVLGDAATDEIIQAWGEAYGVIADVFIQTEEALYKEAETQEGGWRYFKEFIVTKKVQENDKIVSFYLKAADDKKLPAYKPGQYITVQVTIPGEKYLHNRQYSLSQAAGEDAYRISVKREDEGNPSGIVSVYLHEQLQEGDTLKVSAPAGEFHLDTTSKAPVAFISGGVGITPLMSMFETIATTDAERKTAFIHCARSENLHAFDTEIQERLEKMPNAAYIKLNSNEPEGIINRGFIKQNIALESKVYVCGPVGFMEAVINDLYALGFKESQVHFEFFGPAMQLQVKVQA
ncbi:NO-inducible flavohemoprotein [Viridibacillus sp. YIM B01967]|uniref:nitric oxide dioxygenase n=1 Tax=Viridibacillus soli TaxID=2798301 RepID=A0ABS1H2D8_9BACL|nr:NO-inducible flavohemoprotein [Viridibacillus soli]MBK3493556.1 NO-inducible flavohemoprotein [Viridibacillus soli]